ncbi:MAG TPA: hypothetical protein DEP84_28580 [Chloroflexi bacterium]|nr:hypothetical protein [Chloroflexota bacterium]
MSDEAALSRDKAPRLVPLRPLEGAAALVCSGKLLRQRLALLHVDFILLHDNRNRQNHTIALSITLLLIEMPVVSPEAGISLEGRR